MFHVYSNVGRVFSGSLEQWRQMAPTSAVARARRIAPVGHDAFEPRAATDDPPPPSATATARSGVLAAYAAAAQGGQARRPLTRVADVMSRHVQTVPLDANVLQAWQAVRRGIRDRTRVRQCPWTAFHAAYSDGRRPQRARTPSCSRRSSSTIRACTAGCSCSGTRAATDRRMLESGSSPGCVTTSRRVCLMKSRQARRRGSGSTRSCLIARYSCVERS